VRGDQIPAIVPALEAARLTSPRPTLSLVNLRLIQVAFVAGETRVLGVVLRVGPARAPVQTVDQPVRVHPPLALGTCSAVGL